MKEIDGKWIAENGWPSGIDDVVVVDYTFSKKPTHDDVITVYIVDLIESMLKLCPDLAEFNCYSCGTRTHWIDIQVKESGWKGIKAKFENALDKYDGC